MSKQDYIEIKQTFLQMIRGWEARNPELMDGCFTSDVRCFMSIVKDDPHGGCHGIPGMRQIVECTPKTDTLIIRTYNFAARIDGDFAAQSCAIVADAGTTKQAYESFTFTGLFCNEFRKTSEGWKICQIRFDLTDCCGSDTRFLNNWYLGKPESGWYEGIHLPVICGELDNPWRSVPVSQAELTDEELIEEAFACYAYGIDTLCFANLDCILSPDFLSNMAPFSTMDKRSFMQTLKLHRQPSRHWLHPVKTATVHIQGDVANAVFYRTAGHGPRFIPLAADNIDQELACARYEVKFRKEEGIWKLLRLDYFYGGYVIP